MEEDRGFCAFDVTTWSSRIWNEGASGVVFDLRCAYQCWQQDGEQVKLAFGNLVEWIGVLEGGQDPTDRIMNLGRSLLNTFRMQLTIASDPGIRLSKPRARLHTAVHQADAYARAARLFVDRREPNALCDANNVISLDTRRLHAMCVREGITIQAPIKKRPRGCRTPLMNADDRSSIQSATSHQSSQAARRRCSSLYFKSPDAIVGKGNGDYPPTTLDCGTANYRHPRFGQAT
ncbi:helicase-like protein [Trypanosoma cruzi]|nr:helicase-like protein [Trypanosoma cruzi]